MTRFFKKMEIATISHLCIELSQVRVVRAHPGSGHGARRLRHALHKVGVRVRRHAAQCVHVLVAAVPPLPARHVVIARLLCKRLIGDVAWHSIFNNLALVLFSLCLLSAFLRICGI